MNHISFNFVVRKDVTNKEGLSPVYLTSRFNNKNFRVKFPLYVNSANWDETKQRVSVKDAEHQSKNELLIHYEAVASTYISQCLIKKTPMSKTGLELALFGKIISDCYFEFVKSEVENDATFSKETKRTYLAKLSKLKRFRSQISLSEIDYTFLMNYKKWMIESGNKENTYNKDFAIIKSFLNRAIKKGLIERHDFYQIKIRVVEGNREFLTMDELQILRKIYAEDLDDATKTHLQTLLNDDDVDNKTKKIIQKLLNKGVLHKPLKKALQTFLFTCYTGLRYKDLKGLLFEHIKGDFIVKKLHKTKKEVSIPLMSEAKKLLPERTSDSETVFSVYCNQSLNRYLKDLALIAGIGKTISHHCARHTFATLTFDGEETRIEVVSEMLGHTSVKTTRIYAKLLQHQKVKAIDSFNERLNVA